MQISGSAHGYLLNAMDNFMLMLVSLIISSIHASAVQNSYRNTFPFLLPCFFGLYNISTASVLSFPFSFRSEFTQTTLLFDAPVGVVPGGKML